MMAIVFSGFLLGLLHSLEPDHIVAVSAISAKRKNPAQATLIGVLWGIGHAAVIIIVSLAISQFKLLIPSQLFDTVELFVGVILIYLGCRLLRYSLFSPGGVANFHSHSHYSEKVLNKETSSVAPLYIGAMHGLAGSGSVITLLFTENFLLSNVWAMAAFGVGNIISMGCASFFLGLSLHYYRVGKFNYLEKYMMIGIGLVSIIIGLYKAYSIGGTLML